MPRISHSLLLALGVLAGATASRASFDEPLVGESVYFSRGRTLGLSGGFSSTGITGPSLQYRYDGIRSDGFGYSVGAFVEGYRKRLFGGSEANLGVFGNATMELLSGYVFGGLNFALPWIFSSPATTTTYSSWLGWQVGVGFPIGTHIRNIDASPHQFLLEAGLLTLTQRAQYVSGVTRVLSATGLQVSLILNFH